jgi:iron complex transport system permease protein
MMIAALAGALVSLVISLSPFAFDLSGTVSWTTGALTDRSWADVGIVLLLTGLGLGTLARAGRGLDAMSLGEVTARSLGVRPRGLAGLVIVGVGLCVGAGVAAAGVTGFVGLLVPHVMRPLTDRRPSSLLLPSALGGGLLLVLADGLCRILPLAGWDLRLGIAFSLLGAPFLLWLVVVARRRAASTWGGWA